MFGKSRSQKKAEANLGVKSGTLKLGQGMFRKESLNMIDKYLESTQYDHLADWDICDESDDHVPLRKRKPKVIYPFAQLLSERVASKLIGASTFPKLDIPDDPDTAELMQILIDGTHLKPLLLKAMEKFVSHNAVFVRFKIVNGLLKFEYYNSKYCYPEFDQTGELEKIEIKYTYEDIKDIDQNGKPIKKWYKLELNKTTDILYDNPKYNYGEAEPEFTIVNSVNHNVGFVQGEWFQNGESNHSPDGDGKSIVERCFAFMDSLNYNLSQSDKAVLYGQDPQLLVKGMDEDEIDMLIKSSSKGWNLGREGEASFLEVNGSGQATAREHKMDIRKDIQDIARVIMLDPDKIVGSAQSAKAMEVLHGPLVELINQMRPHVKKGLIKLLQKSIALVVLMNQRGMLLAISMPPQYAPMSLDITVAWPAMFPLTTQDKQQIVSMFLQLTSGNIISRETALRNLIAQIPDLEVDDIEAELQRVASQPQFNTFGF